MSDKPNGHSEGPSLEMLGAPRWYCTAHRSLEARIERLETAMISGASKSGATAGRRWGTIVGIFVSAATSAALSHCNFPGIP